MNPAIRGHRTVVGTFPIIVASLVAGLGACAATRMPPRELTDARDEVLEARDSASRLDPTDVHEADLALLNAERAWQNDPDSPSSIDLALIAQRKAQIAVAEAQAAQSTIQAIAARRQIQTLATTQLANVEGQLGQTERQLDQTQDQLQHQRARLTEVETKLKDARATIAKIATVRDDARGMVITLQGELLFKTGQWDLKPAALAKLDEIAQALKGDEQTIDVVGYTDNVGVRANNMDLSQKRASSVRDYLAEKGVPQDLIRAEGRGPDDPAADNGSVEGRATNRRVEIIVEPTRK
jgi:outer membrane protein OmpA-like peptidoglycan-associated protein